MDSIKKDVIVFESDGELTPVVAQKWAEQLVQVKSIIKKAEVALKAHVDKTGGNIPLKDGQAYGYQEKIKRVIENTEGVAKILMAGGVDKVDIWGKMTLAVTKAEKLANGEVDLSPFIIDKASKTFGLIK